MDALSIATGLLKQEEGFRSLPYKDSLGNLTIGYGLALNKHGITEPQAAWILNDILETELQPQLLTLDWYKNLDPIRQAVILNMSYQLGIGGLLAYKTMIAYLADKNYDAAADDLLKSLLAKQAPARTKLHAQILRTGQLS